MSLEYTNIERSFIQLVAGHGMIEKDVAKKIYPQLVKKYAEGDEGENDRTIKDSIALINKRIQDFDQKIVTYDYPLNDKSYYIMINSAFTSINKFQHLFNESELEYFRLIISEIAESDDCCTHPMDLFNLTSKIKTKPVTKNRAQELLDHFIMNGYFYNHDSKIYFGPKMITEFKDYLLQQFPDSIKSCSLCKDIAIWGVSCSHCDHSFHKLCIRKFLSRSNNCPDCSTRWETPMN